MVADVIFLQEIHLNELYKNPKKELGNCAYAASRKISLWQLCSGNMVYYKIIENSSFCRKGLISKHNWIAGDVPNRLKNSWKQSHFPNLQRVLPQSRRPFAVRWLSRTFKSILDIAREKYECPKHSAIALSAGWRLHFHSRISFSLNN